MGFDWENYPKLSIKDQETMDILFGIADKALIKKRFEEAAAAQAAYEARHQGEKRRCCGTHAPDPNQKYAKTWDVPLNEEEKKIWIEFKESDKDNPALDGISIRTLDEQKKRIDVRLPIVSLIGTFAVDAFNDSVEMFVKKGEDKNLEDFEIKECKYLKLPDCYYFTITIEGVEERKFGVYEAKVELKFEDSSKSLGEFVLKNRKPLGERKITRRYRKTRPGTWLYPVVNPGSGLRHRYKFATCRGYDFYTPFDFGFP